MSVSASAAVVGCLLDVSGSMREALEVGRSDEQATERLRSILRAALKLARSEQEIDPTALVFIGVFGLNTENKCPPVIDLCQVAEALLDSSKDKTSGHDRLIARANEHNLEYISRYIRKWLTDDEARIVDAHLQKHPDEVEKFINAIPATFVKTVSLVRNVTQTAGVMVGLDTGSALVLTNNILGVVPEPVRKACTDTIAAGQAAWDGAEDAAVERSEALKLARHMCAEWLRKFQIFAPRPVGNAIHLLKQLQDGPEANEQHNLGAGHGNNPTMLDTLRRYMYGPTPMREALEKSLLAFRERKGAQHRILVLISDGNSTDSDTDDDLLRLGHVLKKGNVTIATIYLTSKPDEASRSLFYREPASPAWNTGRTTLFRMASKMSGLKYPIPALVSAGWAIPSAGEVGLHVTVSTAEALDEFCSILLSARLGSTALLDLAERLSLDKYVNGKHIRTQRNPLDQGDEMTCYAHAGAAVIRMALLRIIGREGDHPEIPEIMKQILKRFPPEKGVKDMRKMMEIAVKMFRPLRVREVNEVEARQAVLRRRPVLTAFFLTKSGWDEFGRHFKKKMPNPRKKPKRKLKRKLKKTKPVLKVSQMEKHRQGPANGGHAVVMIGCDSHSITFLNSWGKDWGNDGSFSIESSRALDLSNPGESPTIRFFDVYWFLEDLTDAERQANDARVDKKVRQFGLKNSWTLDITLRCPHCHKPTPLREFGNAGDSICRVQCPKCNRRFVPGLGFLV